MDKQTIRQQAYHSVKITTEIIVVPLHYLALYHHHLIAFWAGIATLSVYFGATLMLRPQPATEICVTSKSIDNNHDTEY